MAHHKRRRAKNQRAGCLLCKPHKANGADRRTRPELEAERTQVEQLADLYEEELESRHWWPDDDDDSWLYSQAPWWHRHLDRLGGEDPTTSLGDLLATALGGR